MSGGCINELIYMRKWIEVLWACFIQIRIMNTNIPLTTILLKYHHIGQPLRIFNLLNNSRWQELLNFLINNLLPLWGKNSPLQQEWLLLRFYAQSVDRQWWIQSWNITGLPRKYVFIGPEQLNKICSEWLRKVGLYLDQLGRVSWIEFHIFRLFSSYRHQLCDPLKGSISIANCLPFLGSLSIFIILCLFTPTAKDNNWFL